MEKMITLTEIEIIVTDLKWAKAEEEREEGTKWVSGIRYSDGNPLHVIH